jgi:hypothetical protein
VRIVADVEMRVLTHPAAALPMWHDLI